MCIIDVSVTDPTCKSAIARGSHKEALIAGSMREHSKRHSYMNYLTQDMYKNFVPFIVEATGRLSKSTQEYFDKLCKIDKLDLAYSWKVKVARKKFLAKLSYILVNSNANIIRMSRRKVINDSIAYSNVYSARG